MMEQNIELNKYKAGLLAIADLCADALNGKYPPDLGMISAIYGFAVDILKDGMPRDETGN